MPIATRCLVLALSLFSCFSVHAQTEPRAVLEAVAGKLGRELQQENRYLSYLHIDKPWYRSGSTIWFKVYLYNRLNQQVASVKEHVYVDLLAGDSLVKQLVLNSNSREWDGGLVLPSRLPGGYYTLRAYTAAMAQQDARDISVRQVYVVGEGEDISTSKGKATSAATGLQLRFFPEGGSLVNGLDNTVSVLATDNNGRPLAVSGVIMDDNNKKMADWSTDASGEGILRFAPYKNRQYHAEVKGADGKVLRFPLPAINYFATQLVLVSQSAQTARFRVVLGDSVYAAKPASYLLGAARGAIQFAAMGNGMFELDVPLDKFPSGPATFYLFNDKQQEMSRRTILVQGRTPKVSIVPDKDNYASRAKAIVNIQLNDADGQPLRALLSVAVTDDRLVDRGPATDTWKQGLTESAGIRSADTKALPPAVMASADTSLQISGRVIDRSDQPVPGQVITVLAEGTSFVLSDTTDPAGRFGFYGLEFPDASPFMAQVKDPQAQKRVISIQLDPSAPVAVQTAVDPAASAWIAGSPALKSFRLQQADSLLTGTTPVVLEEIRLQAPKSGKKGKSDVALRSASSRMITGEQLDKLGLGTTVQAVQMLPGVMMVGSQLTIRGGSPGVVSSGTLEPLLIIDGVPSAGSITSQLNSINPKLIETIEVITGGEAARYGTRAANGVIVVKTANQLRPDMAADERGIQYIYPRGYHQKPAFYAPPYEVPGIREAEFTDNRSTLHWIGELATDLSGKAQFSFYTGDLKASYSIRVVGISAKGDLIDQTVKVNRL